MKTVCGDDQVEALFLVPPAQLNKKKLSVDRLYGCNYGFDYKTPLHLLQSATALRDKGCNVRFLDCPAEGYDLKKFAGFISRQKRLGLVVFFTVWLSSQEDIAAARIISDLAKGVNIVFIGPYPTWQPELFLKKDNYFVVRAEPEQALVELARGLKEDEPVSGVKNVSFSGKAGIQHNPSRELLVLDELPIPDRRLLQGSYSFNRLNSFPATAACFSRGCTFKCSYCAPQAGDQSVELEYQKNSREKPPLRSRSVENMIREFHDIHSLGYKGVEICDNQFVWDKKKVIAVCEGIKGLGLEWICCARADHLKDKPMLLAMREAGCRLVYTGTESFDQRILDDTGKDMAVEDALKAVKLLRECGIEPEISVLFGASGLETESSLRYSVKEARKLKTRFIHYSVAMPLPNTRLYRTARQKGWLKNDFSPEDNIRAGLLDLPLISARKLKSMVRGCYLRQYLSFGFICSQVFAPGFFRKFWPRLSALKKLITYIFSPS
ncbi:MAG: radical SAM protein [Candidatus Omnitrophica bacterium]|jgi:radical SAM superfamily enzyme YgiQ (UPF0313 family)|nr:B12-binding domain-containing radical SAM protein [Candidatus Omnitrophota bacterium]MDD5080182.1 radical SAM protein [Candidatus Omnitrophota bacterium]